MHLFLLQGVACEVNTPIHNNQKQNNIHCPRPSMAQNIRICVVGKDLGLQPWCWSESRKMWVEEEICAMFFPFPIQILGSRLPNHGRSEQAILSSFYQCQRHNNNDTIFFLRLNSIAWLVSMYIHVSVSSLYFTNTVS